MNQLHDSPKTALVTGGSGFVGRHLVRELTIRGWQVHCLARSSSRAFLAGESADGTTWHAIDGKMKGLVDIVRSTQPTVVFHLASLFLSEHRPEDVGGLVESNVVFGAQLLEAMSQCNVRLLVNTGTSWQNYEGDAFNPVNLYAATKQAFEDIARYYCEARELKMVTLRLFDTYGPDDNRAKLLPALARFAVEKKVLALSPGEQEIDLVHVADVVDCFEMAAWRLLGGRVIRPEVYAVRSGRPVKLRDLIPMYTAATGREITVDWGARPYRAREVMRPWASGQTLDGWRPKIGLEAGLRTLA